MTRTRFISVLNVFLTISLVGGCTRSKPWDHVYVSTGTVTFMGKPVKNAEISFFPEDETFPESVRPWARSNEQGEFKVSTYRDGDGAPAGKYKVTVIHNEVKIIGETVTAVPNDLPKQYASKNTTSLRVEIGSYPTVIPPLELMP